MIREKELDRRVWLFPNIAEEKKKEELWDLVNQAIDITTGAQEGAETALAKDPDKPAQKKNR